MHVGTGPTDGLSVGACPSAGFHGRLERWGLSLCRISSAGFGVVGSVPMVELRGVWPHTRLGSIRDWGVWGQTLLLPGTVGTDPATPKGYDVLAGDCSAKYGVKS